MFGEVCLLDIPKKRKATKFAITIAKLLWTYDERLKGIIEPQKANCKATELTGERLALLKSKWKRFNLITVVLSFKLF